MSLYTSIFASFFSFGIGFLLNVLSVNAVWVLFIPSVYGGKLECKWLVYQEWMNCISSVDAIHLKCEQLGALGFGFFQFDLLALG